MLSSDGQGFIPDVELLFALDLSEMQWATGLVIDIRNDDGSNPQIIGPYPKDTPEIFQVIKRLISEEDPDGPPCQYVVYPLMPPEFAEPIR